MVELTSIKQIVDGIVARLAPIPKVFKCLNCERTVCNLRGATPKSCKWCFSGSMYMKELN